jgi:hypothetical protein
VKIYNFSLCYLGGEVDLVKLSKRLSARYPGAVLDFVRGQNLVNVPLDQGTLSLAGGDISYQTVCHQYESGFGSMVTALEMEHRDYDADIRIAREAVGHQRMAAAKLNYMNIVFGVESAGELFGICRLPEERKRLKDDGGLNLKTVGLNEINIGIQEFDCYWLSGEGFDEATKAPWRDVSGGARQLAAADNNRFWSPGRGDELYWDMVNILIREHMAVYLRTYSEAWIGYIRQQMNLIRDNLGERNQELLSQEHGDLERMESDFLSFSIMVKVALSGQAYLRSRPSGPASLRIIEPTEWGHFSRFDDQRVLIEGLVAEGKYAIKRMIRPLEFREFKLLKTGVEQLELLIMLLTVLLVVMELFAQFAEPGHWRLKGLLTLLLVAIPGTYALWSVTRRSRSQRRGRKLYLKHLIDSMEEGVQIKEEQIRELKATGGMAPETRERYIRTNEEILRQYRTRAKEYQEELKRL